MPDYHEPIEELSAEARNFSRALHSLKEEIEAINWYHQRVDVTDDDQLRKVLAHNRDEEIEHACMALEWLRRNMPAWNEHLSTYLFTEADITAIEEGESTESEKQTDEPDSGDLKIGKI